MERYRLSLIHICPEGGKAGCCNGTSGQSTAYLRCRRYEGSDGGICPCVQAGSHISGTKEACIERVSVGGGRGLSLIHISTWPGPL